MKSIHIFVAATALLAAPAMAESPAPSSNIPSENTGAMGNTNSTVTPIPRVTSPDFERTEGTLDQQRAINAQKAGTLPPQDTLDGRGAGSPTEPRTNPAWKGVDGKPDVTP